MRVAVIEVGLELAGVGLDELLGLPVSQGVGALGGRACLREAALIVVGDDVGVTPDLIRREPDVVQYLRPLCRLGVEHLVADGAWPQRDAFAAPLDRDVEQDGDRRNVVPLRCRQKVLTTPRLQVGGR